MQEEFVGAQPVGDRCVRRLSLLTCSPVDVRTGPPRGVTLTAVLPRSTELWGKSHPCRVAAVTHILSKYACAIRVPSGH